MGLTSILLIVLAAVVLFLMYRVGRGNRETADVPVAARMQDPDVQGPVDRLGRAEDGADSDGRPRHGCC